MKISCPKCDASGTVPDHEVISVKTCVERQREEQLLKHNQELLGKKLNNSESA